MRRNRKKLLFIAPLAIVGIALFLFVGGEVVKLWRGVVVDDRGAPGEVIEASAAGIVVACGEQALRITELQRPGGRRVSAAQFLAGTSLAVGTRLQQPG